MCQKCDKWIWNCIVGFHVFEHNNCANIVNIYYKVYIDNIFILKSTCHMTNYLSLLWIYLTFIMLYLNFKIYVSKKY